MNTVQPQSAFNHKTYLIFRPLNVKYECNNKHSPDRSGSGFNLGIDPREKHYLMLIRIHYRTGFQELASRIIECAGVGDYAVYAMTTTRARGPGYPLERAQKRFS